MGSPRRPEAFAAAIGAGVLPAGWAIDDGIAALFTGGELTEVVARKPGVQLRHVAPVDGGVATTVPMPAREIHPIR